MDLSPLLFSSEDEDEDHDMHKRRPRNFRQRINYNYTNEFEFKECFRVSSPTFEFILERIADKLKHKTERNMALSPQQQLMTALNWYGSGTQYHGLGRAHGISKHTVQRCVHRVATLVITELFQDQVRWPMEHILDIPVKFQRLANFPRVAGCVDGSLIPIDAPQEDEVAYVDRKGNHSINMMAVAGPDLEFYYASARWPGSVSDARVLRNSTIHRDFENGFRPFPNAVLLGDSIYGLKNWLITPVLNGPLNQTRQRFLQAHKSTRRVVECAFGLMKEKFPILNKMRVQPTLACKLILTCVTIHNIEKKYQEETGNFYEPDIAGSEELEYTELDENQLEGTASEVLNDLVNSFA